MLKKLHLYIYATAQFGQKQFELSNLLLIEGWRFGLRTKGWPNQGHHLSNIFARKNDIPDTLINLAEGFLIPFQLNCGHLIIPAQVSPYGFYNLCRELAKLSL